MFSPPGTKIFASRLHNRKQNKMQRTAMKEALAAGWQRYTSDNEDSDDDGDDNDNDSAVQDLLQIDETERTEVSHSMSMNNDGIVQMNMYANDASPRPVSFDGDIDDDSSMESDDDEDADESALANVDLHVFLDQLSQQTNPKNRAELNPYKDGVQTAQSNDQDRTEIPIGNRSKKDQVDTTVPSHDSMDSSDEDDGISEIDSLDLGVPTSVWPSANENPYAAATNSSTTKCAIAEIVTITNVFSPSQEKQAYQNYNGADTDYADENYSDDDEPHEGSEVFLFTEGARYSGRSTGRTSVGNELTNIHEKESLSFLANESKIDEGEDIDDTFESRGADLTLVINDDNDDAKPRSGDNCFGSIQLISPKFFNTDEKPLSSNDTQPTPVMSPLSSMVHPMNLALFDFNDVDRSIKQREEKRLLFNESGGSTNRVDRVPTSILTSIEQDYAFTDDENRRSKLSTSFKSSTKSNRIAYHISNGKKSMSKTELVYSKSFLPKEQVQNIQISSSTRSSSQHSNRGSLAVLLADIKTKVFEVVAIDVQQDTSVGDVLSKARSSATDPALSDQKYTSFCYGVQEFGAPMLPVNLVIDWEKHKTRPLVVAVPVGSTASEMQSVKRVLWKNPKLRDWWKQDDPFVPKTKPEVAEAPISLVPLTESTNAAKKKSVPNDPFAPKTKQADVDGPVPSVPLAESTKTASEAFLPAAPTMDGTNPVPTISVIPATPAMEETSPVSVRRFIPAPPTMVSTLRAYERIEV
jgi:hypothetical protein